MVTMRISAALARLRERVSQIERLSETLSSSLPGTARELSLNAHDQRADIAILEHDLNITPAPEKTEISSDEG